MDWLFWFGRGSVENGSGQVANPFDEIMRRKVNAGPDPRYQFTSKECDTETGLDYFGARYYDSWRGQWLSVDPMGSKYPGWSSYNYAADNPLRFVDSAGMDLGWYQNQEGNMAYDPSINSQQDLVDRGIAGQYLGQFWWTANQEGDLTFYNPNGAITPGTFMAPEVVSTAIGTPNSLAENLTLGMTAFGVSMEAQASILDFAEKSSTSLLEGDKAFSWLCGSTDVLAKGATGVSTGVALVGFAEHPSLRSAANLTIEGAALNPYLTIPVAALDILGLKEKILEKIPNDKWW